MVTWTCPTSGTGATNAQAILATDTTFFNWMQSSDRASCTTVKDFDVYAAMINRSNGENNSSTTLWNLNAQIANQTAILKTKTDEANIAKDRASMSLRPEMTASYYDGWFPLHRPMKRAAVILLLGLSTFLFIISLFLLLNSVGIVSKFAAYVPYNGTTTDSSGPILTLMGIIAILTGVIIYAFNR
jgi:hypothetical protein